jgi:hypothetical protein
MAKKLFERGNKAAVGNGRPPGSGHRQAMEKALKEYGEGKFWKETFEKAKSDSTIRIALLKKMLPEQIDLNIPKMVALDL